MRRSAGLSRYAALLFLPVEIRRSALCTTTIAETLTISPIRLAGSRLDIAGGHRLRKGQVENQVGVMRRRVLRTSAALQDHYAELNAWLGTAASPGPRPTRIRMARQDDPGDLRGRAREPRALCRAVRRLPRRAGRGVEDLPRPLRQEPPTRVEARAVGSAGRDPCLGRARGVLAGRPDRRSAPARPSEATRPSMTRCTTSPCSPASPARSGTAPPFKEWDLPPSMRRVQRKLGRVPNGDRQMVDILGAVLTEWARCRGSRLRRSARPRRPFPPTSADVAEADIEFARRPDLGDV